MTLKDLVPPLALCRKIPKGKFEDSALVWSRRTSRFAPHEWVIPRGYAAEVSDIAPAPTLAEMIAAIPYTCMDNYLTTKGIFTITSMHNGKNYGAWDHNPATAALKLWLELEAKNE